MRVFRQWSLLLVCLLCPVAAGAQTRAYLDAPVVSSVIRIEYDKPSKKIKYAIDNEMVTHDVTPEALLLARTNTAIIVTYRRMNPLRLQATAAITDVDDPSHANIVKLLNAIMAIVAVVNPEAVPAGGGGALAQMTEAGCSLDQPLKDAMSLDAALYGTASTAPTIRGKVKDWIKAIDDGFLTGDGEAAIAAGAAKVDAFVDDLAAAVTNAKPIVDRIQVEARKSKPTDRCSLLQHAFYDMLNLTDPVERLAELNGLKSAVELLAKTLREEYGEGHWITGTDDFRVSGDISPTGATAKKVVVKVNSVDFDVNEANSALTIGTTSAASATFTVRKYSPFGVEVGTGIVFGFVNRPKYGTSKNAADETVVAATNDEVSVDPTLILNFVCRCEAGPFISPMFQVGTSTAKATPAILLGGGFRLFGLGKGDVAVGAGTVLAFVEELDKLAVGDVVKGTADIDADLKWHPRLRTIDAEGNKHTNWYLTLQYKF